MMRSLVFFVLIYVTTTFAFGQHGSFQYQQKIEAVNASGWYGINMPGDLFQKLNSNFGDLRILKITGPDTTAIPYLIKTSESSLQPEIIPFRQINKSTRDGKLFVTFEVSKDETINRVVFNFEEKNFDATVTLEGSHDQKEWFVMADKERIAGIDKQGKQFLYNEVGFPASNYHYVRTTIAGTPLTFIDATIESTLEKKGVYHSPDLTWKVTSPESARETVIEIQLKNPEPINTMSVHVNSKTDFYRAYALNAFVDSVKLNHGYLVNYRSLQSGYITSISANDIEFDLTMASKLKFRIYNEDNAPLDISKIELRRPEYTIVGQFEPGDDYYLFYGNKTLQKPSYDIIHFEKNIPDSLQFLQLEKEVSLAQETINEILPLFKNPVWLWSLIAVMIAVLGFFTLRMIKKK